MHKRDGAGSGLNAQRLSYIPWTPPLITLQQILNGTRQTYRLYMLLITYDVVCSLSLV